MNIKTYVVTVECNPDNTVTRARLDIQANSSKTAEFAARLILRSACVDWSKMSTKLKEESSDTPLTFFCVHGIHEKPCRCVKTGG